MGARGHRTRQLSLLVLKGKVRFLVINVLNDCCICMWLIVCMHAGISRQNSFKGGGGGGNCETREKSIIFYFFIYCFFF